MGLVVNPDTAFRLCHGYKIDDELILWSEGVIGALSDFQEIKCQQILIENAKGGPRTFSNLEDALKVRTSGVPEGRIKQMAAIRQCAGILDKAEDAGVIRGATDVYALMDYCMDKLGYDGVQRKVPERIKAFVDKGLAGEIGSVPWLETPKR